ncbi:unnamed protein product [Didymodactylos carnosus]|uniref:Uncharacterized protein n=1 Tax=Didymodactylos carnosus TaxID=1234261 RepID=A0A8S2DIC9_9BILA|nr:unnamed protein product [Didymodactylos carnosus]CAF3720040.1 unnamed protein product [Didymodactylos carnosus]
MTHESLPLPCRYSIPAWSITYHPVGSIKKRFSSWRPSVAQTDHIKQLFHRQDSSNRFIGETQSELMKVDHQQIEKKLANDSWGKNYKWKNSNIDEIMKDIRECYLDRDLRDIKGIELIHWLMDKASKENDLTYVVTAYTAETDYCKVLNQQLATIHESEWGKNNWFGRRNILWIMGSHPSLDCFSFIGITYRCMRVNDDELTQYSVGTRLMNKAFLSTSKDLRTAQSWNGTVLFIYEIRHHRSALIIFIIG